MIKFERFFDKKLLINTGKANISLSLESLFGMGLSGLLTLWAWSIWGFTVFMPNTDFDLGAIFSILFWAFNFVLFKFFTAKRSIMERLEDLKSLFVPTIKISRDADLIPPYLDENNE
jgi:hypothetical protein